MKKLLVAVFDTDTEAFNSAVAINNLHKEGDISVFGSVVLEKDSEGEIQVKQSKDKGGNNWALGILGGSLIGAFAGTSGVALGASVGGLTGLCIDFNRAGIDISFITEVSEAIEPGMTALVVDLDENWTTPVDTCVEVNNGIVFRRNRADVIEEHLQRESEALTQECAEIKSDLENASDESKASMQSHLDELVKKTQETKDLISKRVTDIQTEASLKVATLKTQLTGASEQGKAKIEQRLTTLKGEVSKKQVKLQNSIDKLKS